MGSRLRENVSHIYECFCEVVKPTATSEAWTIQKFPDRYKDEELLKSVPKFAYPCQFDNSMVQHYSFVLTSVDSKWTFGFCRHDPKSETALVILSFLPWHEVFYRLLNHISELLHGGDTDRLLTFLNNVYQSRPPDPARSLTFPLYPQATQVFICQAPKAYQLASIPENRNLSEYYNAVDAETMIGVFASMLTERRIVFTSKKLSRLSGCVQAANALLYPMSWQHIFIPVLPEHLVDYLLAPMPYLIGVPHSLAHMVDKPDVGDVVVLDTDAGTLLTPHDDVSTLPHSIIKQLRSDLRNKAMLLGDGVSRAFLRALVALIGGYRDALRFHQGENITFDETAFVESRPVSLQPFLSKMLHLQIFQQFVDERLSLLNAGLGFSDEFELENCNYSDKASSRLKAQYKDWTHTVKKEGSAFIKTVKTKANPAMKSAVKSVKDRGKDVRQAYKGIKTRLKEQLTDDRANRPRSTNVYSKQLTNTPSQTVGCSSPEPPSLDMDLMSDLQHVLFSSTPFLGSTSTQMKPGRSLESFVGAGGNWPMVDQDGVSTGSRDSLSQNTNLQVKSNSSKDLIDWNDDAAEERWPRDSELLLEYGLDFSSLSVAGGTTSSADSGISAGSSGFPASACSSGIPGGSSSLPKSGFTADSSYVPPIGSGLTVSNASLPSDCSRISPKNTGNNANLVAGNIEISDESTADQFDGLSSGQSFSNVVQPVNTAIQPFNSGSQSVNTVTKPFSSGNQSVNSVIKPFSSGSQHVNTVIKPFISGSQPFNTAVKPGQPVKPHPIATNHRSNNSSLPVGKPPRPVLDSNTSGLPPILSLQTKWVELSPPPPPPQRLNWTKFE